MKYFHLSGTLLFIVLILITAFSNLQGTCNSLSFLFTRLDSGISPTFLIFGVSMMGAFAGAFIFGLIQSMMKGEEEDEE